MPIVGMDHFTILTTNASETVAFYRDILGSLPGRGRRSRSPGLAL